MNSQLEKELAAFHSEALANYHSGCRTATGILSPSSLNALAGYGISPFFVFDYVDDGVRYGEPDLETFLKVAIIRVKYFRDVLHSNPAPVEVPERALPLKSDEFQGVSWLPRIIEKARCLLAGSLCSDIMYGCSGDRAFLAKFHATLPGFLEVVRDSSGDPEPALRYLKK
jgi:hypothetical protein